MLQCRQAYRKSSSCSLLGLTSTTCGSTVSGTTSLPLAMYAKSRGSWRLTPGPDMVSFLAFASAFRLR